MSDASRERERIENGCLIEKEYEEEREGYEVIGACCVISEE